MTSCGVLLQCVELLSTEAFIVDVTCCFDQILKMSSGEEVAQSNEITMSFVLDIDDTPSVLTTSNNLALDIDILFRSNNSEWDEGLDLTVVVDFFVIILAIFVWEHVQLVESEFLLYSFFECLTFLESHAVGFRNDGDYVHYSTKLAQDNNIDRLEAVKLLAYPRNCTWIRTHDRMAE